MAIPTQRAPVQCSREADGYIWHGDGSDTSQWQFDPNPWTNLAPSRTVFADDGAMGSSFIRLGDPTGATRTMGFVYPLAFFDQTQPIRTTQRVRIQFTPGQELDFTGLGLFYCGEAIYDGVSSWNGRSGNSTVGAKSWVGMYRVDMGGPYLSPGDIADYEQEWDPATWTIRARYRVNGGAWSSWTSRTNPAGSPAGTYPHLYRVPTVDPGGASFLWPVTMFFWHWNDLGWADVGTTKIDGTPLFGCMDSIGWVDLAGGGSGWGYIVGQDASNVIGGLTGQESDAKQIIDHNNFVWWKRAPLHAGASVTAKWAWQSKVIVPEGGYRFKHLTLHAYNDGAGSLPNGRKLAVQIRDPNQPADDADGIARGQGRLFPDSMVPGNSTGILTTATALVPGGTPFPGSGMWAGPTSGMVPPSSWQGYSVPTTGAYANIRGDSVGVQRVALSIPASTEVYLDIQGETLAADGTYVNQARLGMWMLSPEITGPITERSAAPADATAFAAGVYGFKGSGSASSSALAGSPALALGLHAAAGIAQAAAASVALELGLSSSAASALAQAAGALAVGRVADAADACAEAEVPDLALELVAAHADALATASGARLALHQSMSFRAALGSQKRLTPRVWNGGGWQPAAARLFNGSNF